MRVVIGIPARMGSTRLPNKVMMPINGIPLIEILLKRLSNSKKISKIISRELESLIQQIQVLEEKIDKQEVARS